MESSGFYAFFYAVGSVLPGYALILVLWSVTKTWNRFLPTRSVNPWTLPLVGSVILESLAVINVFTEGADVREGVVVIVGCFAALAFCGLRWYRHRSRAHLKQNSDW